MCLVAVLTVKACLVAVLTVKISHCSHADSEGMLITQSMRKAIWEARFAGYERAVLRIHFAGHIIVQAVFRPRETGL